MKTSHGIAKSRGSYSRRTAINTSCKRLRRLHPPLEDDDDDDDEPVEVELSPGQPLSSEQNDDADTINDDALIFIDFDPASQNGPDSGCDLDAIVARDFGQQLLHSEELDQLQFELEKLLTESILKKRNFHSALKQLTTPSCSTDGKATSATTRSVSAAGIAPSSVRKRGFPKTPQPLTKRPKVSGITTTVSSAGSTKRNRGAGNKSERPFRYDAAPRTSRVYYYAQHNHQMPDKFWDFIDEYAGAIEPEMLELLRKLVTESDWQSPESKSCYNMPERKQIRPSSSARKGSISPEGQDNKSESTTSSSAKKPTAGGRRSARKEVQSNGVTGRNEESVASRSRKRLSTASSSNTTKSSGGSSFTGIKNSRNGDVDSDSNGFLVGPLTERLVQTLIEDYANGDADLSSKNASEGKITKPPASNSKAFMKTLDLGNLKALENRIRKELIDQGLLDTQDDQDESDGDTRQRDGAGIAAATTDDGGDDDEVTAELKRRQKELLHLQMSNHERLRRLLTTAEARAEVARKEESVREANEEVLNLCGRYYGVAPTSRKPSNKAERDSLWKALKEREKAIGNGQ